LVLKCNKNCYCSIKCPWGRSEYPDESGLVEFHKYLFSIFVRKGIKMPVAEASISSRSFDGFVGIVPDYLEQVKIRFLDDSHWPVRPSICFEKESGPMLCICSRHSSGSKLHYLHPPRNPLNSTMPSTRGDPISHVTMVPRTIRTIKTNNKYSTTFQMQACNGGYSGIDSCDVKETGVFDKCNIISRNNACLALHFRPDIVGKLRQMVETKVVPQIYEDSSYNDLASLQLNKLHVELQVGLQRSTQMNMIDALKVTYNEDNLSKLEFLPSWPLILPKCHSISSPHGPEPPIVPSFHVVLRLSLALLYVTYGYKYTIVMGR
jgi:hypothetical protein